VTGRLSVAHVVLSLDPGGLERVVLALARAGCERGHGAAVVCLERPGRLAPDAERAGARVVCLDKPPGLRPGLVGKLRAAFRSLEPDVVHTHQVGALLYAGLATARPVVHTQHGREILWRPRRRLLARLSAARAARFVCVSRDLAREVSAGRLVPTRKLRVVPNGVSTEPACGPGDGADVRRSLGIPDGAAVVGTVGRLDEIKRQDDLIRALSRLGGDGPAPHLLLVGDGPALGPLRSLAEGAGLGRRVHFVGYQERPGRYLAAMDVFALPSRSEGMPLAVLEAWAAGLPVVASRVGGLPELAGDGAAILVEPGDVPALAGSLGEVLADPARARELGMAGRERVATLFGLDVMVDSYLRQYREVLGADHADPGDHQPVP